MLYRTFLSSLFFLIRFTCFSQESSRQEPPLTTDQYRQDFAFLRTSFEKSYPSLYRFRNKSSIDNLFDSCLASISKETNLTTFYATVKFVLSALGDGHIGSSPSPALRNSFDSVAYFPLSMVFLDEAIYNFCDHTLIPKGAKIISINDVPAQSIRERIYPYLASDGTIRTSKNSFLNSNFWLYYYLVFGKQQTFAVLYSLPDSGTKTASINAQQRKDFNCARFSFKQHTDLLDLSYPTEKVALMTIKTFSQNTLTTAKKDFSAFLDQSFTAIKQKGIKHLIIDLRSNGGGADEYGAYLYSYLSNKSFRYYQELETKEKKLTIADHPNLGLQKPAPLHFDGEVLFLINGLTFSAAAEFCSIARTNNRGKFIGEETGGGYYGNTSGGAVNVMLKNTGISVSIPTTKYVMAVQPAKEKSRGIIPDYPVVPTIKDILQNRDVQMEEAMKIIASKHP